MQMHTFVDRFGRVLIPKIMREHLGLHAGARLEIEEENHRLTLKPQYQKPLIVEDEGVLVYNGASVGGMDDLVKRDRDNRDKKIGKLK